VTQPLKNLHLIPDDIPIILGANKHEGEMFVHSAFPITMSKQIYWMFVGALFRDSASRVLRHYREYVDQIEKEAEELARKQIEEEENRQYYQEYREQLDYEYQLLLEMNSSRSKPSDSPFLGVGVEALVDTWSRGGALLDYNNSTGPHQPWHHRLWPFAQNVSEESIAEKEQSIAEKARIREERRRAKAKERALKAAAKVVVDYRPVMSRIIDDYLFRCPTWNFAHSLSRNRLDRGQRNNVYVYQFSHSTHIPGYKECWGKVRGDDACLLEDVSN
jgi:carboxylesterase type B